MIRSTLNLPDRMISRRATQPGFKLEAALIAVFGILGTLGVGYVGLQVLDVYEGTASSLRFQFIGAALRPFGALIAAWIGYTVVSHLLAGVYGGRGPASRLLRGAAWALVPIGLWIALRSLVIYALFLDVNLSGDPDGFSASAHYEYYMDLGLDNPIYAAFVFFGVLFAVWSWHLLAKAVAEAKNIDFEDARKVAAIPAGAVALYLVWMGLGVLGVV